MRPLRSVEYAQLEPARPGTAAAVSRVGGSEGSAHAVPDEVLSDITHLLVSQDSPHRVLEAVADALAELVQHDSLTLYQADPPLRVLRPVLVRHPNVREILAMGPVPYGVGLPGLAADTCVPQLANDHSLDPRAQQIPNTPIEPESMLAIPLLARDELKGVLCLYRLGEENRFNVREFKLAVVFSGLAALAIDNAQIRTKLENEVVTDHLTALYNHRYFHERLAEELRRANRRRLPVGLIIFDIDDFKRVNDTYGHLVGDQVLQGMATITRETCRSEDVICRIGGEEFGIILPGCTLAEAATLAERLRRGVASVSFSVAGDITVSLGVAEGPLHASSPRELIACADFGMLQAKAAGKNQVKLYSDEQPSLLTDDLFSESPAVRLPFGGGAGGLRLAWTHERGVAGPAASRPNGSGNGHRPRGNVDATGNGTHARMASLAARGEPRSVAHLRTLEGVSTKLNRLNDVRQIGEAITAELRTLIDYHNCRVFLLQPDQETLLPIAFRGSLTEYQGETFDALITKVGFGMTGHVAQTGHSHYAPDANDDPYATTIPGTLDIEESILGVPLLYGDRVTGVIVLSKLGVDQFDEEDMRLLEALASNAAVAFENARLLQVEREAAQVSSALLALSQALTRVQEMEAVLDEALNAIPAMLACSTIGAWIREPAGFRLIRHRGFDEEFAARLADHVVPDSLAEAFSLAWDRPFVITREVTETFPAEYRVIEEGREMIVAPMHWEPEGLGALVVMALQPDGRFSEPDLGLARGIADITSLALGNAQRFVDLERAYVSTVEALANAVEAKDEYTSDHCRALAEMALAVGVEMGVTGERLKVLELGALFHDIGKIGVPTDMIRKPGRLTAAERREMNRHPAIGAQILAPVPFLQPVRPIVEASHERWDGHGYPNGLRAQEIPLESRIVFVCDAFHAMATDRPYRAALPEREAIRRLKLSSGTQFDPMVVATFVRLHAAGRIQFQ